MVATFDVPILAAVIAQAAAGGPNPYLLAIITAGLGATVAAVATLLKARSDARQAASSSTVAERDSDRKELRDLRDEVIELLERVRVCDGERKKFELSCMDLDARLARVMIERDGAVTARDIATREAAMLRTTVGELREQLRDAGAEGEP